MEAKIDHMTVQLSEMRPVLLRDSADRVEIDQLRREIDASHDKHRTHFAALADAKEQVRRVEDRERQQREEIKATILERVDRLEKRYVRVGGILLGAIAVLQLLVPALSPVLGNLLKAVTGP